MAKTTRKYKSSNIRNIGIIHVDEVLNEDIPLYNTRINVNDIGILLKNPVPMCCMQFDDDYSPFVFRIKGRLYDTKTHWVRLGSRPVIPFSFIWIPIPIVACNKNSDMGAFDVYFVPSYVNEPTTSQILVVGYIDNHKNVIYA
jgi:hypothetical protein